MLVCPTMGRDHKGNDKGGALVDDGAEGGQPFTEGRSAALEDRASRQRHECPLASSLGDSPRVSIERGTPVDLERSDCWSVTIWNPTMDRVLARWSVTRACARAAWTPDALEGNEAWLSPADRASGSRHLLVSSHGEPWHAPAPDHFLGSSEWLVRRHGVPPASEPAHRPRDSSVHVRHLGASEHLPARLDVAVFKDKDARERPACTWDEGEASPVNRPAGKP